MGTSTWTGPIKAGDMLNSVGSVPGELRNVGYALMVQSDNITQVTNVAVAGLYKSNIVIPKKSQITRITLGVTVVWDGAAATFNVGTTVAGNELAVAGGNTAAALGIVNVIPGADATRMGVWHDVGNTDVQIYVLSTNTGAGVGVLTVEYVQARDLS